MQAEPRTVVDAPIVVRTGTATVVTGTATVVTGTGTVVTGHTTIPQPLEQLHSLIVTLDALYSHPI